MKQYFVEKATETMFTNIIAIDNQSSGDFIRGVNRGTLALLNALVETLPEEIENV